MRITLRLLLVAIAGASIALVGLVHHVPFECDGCAGSGVASASRNLACRRCAGRGTVSLAERRSGCKTCGVCGVPRAARQAACVECVERLTPGGTTPEAVLRKLWRAESEGDWRTVFECWGPETMRETLLSMFSIGGLYGSSEHQERWTALCRRHGLRPTWLGPDNMPRGHDAQAEFFVALHSGASRSVTDEVIAEIVQAETTATIRTNEREYRFIRHGGRWFRFEIPA